jgi:hypothetical protein
MPFPLLVLNMDVEVVLSPKFSTAWPVINFLILIEVFEHIILEF